MRARFISHYDPVQFPFAALVLDELGIRSFDDLPSGSGISVAEASRIQRDVRRRFTSISLTSPIITTFQRFMRDVVSLEFAGSLSYARRPVIRIQLAHGPSISGLHRDAEYTGRFDYINGWLPLLATDADTALHVETDYGSGTLAPQPLDHGQVLYFDAGLLLHGSRDNVGDRPRASIDFRFVAKQPGAPARLITGSRPPALVEQAMQAYQRNCQEGTDSATRQASAARW